MKKWVDYGFEFVDEESYLKERSAEIYRERSNIEKEE